MAAQAGAARETVLKEAAEQRFVGRQCDQTVADVAGREDVVVAAQAAGAASVVRDGDDGGQIGEGQADKRAATATDIALETAEQRGETGATTESDDTRRDPNDSRGAFAGKISWPSLPGRGAR